MVVWLEYWCLNFASGWFWKNWSKHSGMWRVSIVSYNCKREHDLNFCLISCFQSASYLHHQCMLNIHRRCLSSGLLHMFCENPKIHPWYGAKWSYCDITPPTNHCIWYHITVPWGHLALVNCIEQFHEICVAGFINIPRRHTLPLVALIP